MKRKQAKITRKTSETDIKIDLTIDGRGKSNIQTGIPFLDHMLTSLAKHGLFDLTVAARGDLNVGLHHTNEDVGIVLGEAFAEALSTKIGIRRFGCFSAPMDDALARVTLDISGRPSFSAIQAKGVKFSRQKEYSFHDACEFLKSFAQHAGINLIVEIVQGDDTHHIIEALFKALAKALDIATQVDPRVKGIPSTKGKL